jgi:hypothetical protein
MRKTSQTYDASKLRALWVSKVLKVHDKSAAAIIELGKTLNDAKDELDQHGQWQTVFELKELPFSLSLAERYMRIASDHKLTESASLQNLPSALSTLYALSQLSDEAFHQAIAEGKIHPGTTSKAAAAWASPIIKSSRRANPLSRPSRCSPMSCSGKSRSESPNSKTEHGFAQSGSMLISRSERRPQLMG